MIAIFIRRNQPTRSEKEQIKGHTKTVQATHNRTRYVLIKDHGIHFTLLYKSTPLYLPRSHKSNVQQ